MIEKLIQIPLLKSVSISIWNVEILYTVQLKHPMTFSTYDSRLDWIKHLMRVEVAVPEALVGYLWSYLLQRSLWLFFLDSENKEDPVAFWKLSLGDFTAFVIYIDTPFFFIS